MTTKEEIGKLRGRVKKLEREIEALKLITIPTTYPVPWPAPHELQQPDWEITWSQTNFPPETTYTFLPTETS